MCVYKTNIHMYTYTYIYIFFLNLSNIIYIFYTSYILNNTPYQIIDIILHIRIRDSLDRYSLSLSDCNVQINKFCDFKANAADV